jgi:hypothetical protein
VPEVVRPCYVDAPISLRGSYIIANDLRAALVWVCLKPILDTDKLQVGSCLENEGPTLLKVIVVHIIDIGMGFPCPAAHYHDVVDLWDDS